MNKKGKRALLAATAFVASLNMNGCGVYGPPPKEPDSPASTNLNQDVYDPPEYYSFRYFRASLDRRSKVCSDCSSRLYCGGGAFHSWDFDGCEQRVCFKNVLFS